MAITPANGGYKGYHNYYVPEEFVKRDPQTGSLHLRDGQRAIYASEDFVVGLHAGLHEEVGDAANTIMYRCGYEWGLQDMKRFADRMRHEFGGGKTDIWEMNQMFVMESWWWPLTVEGWGSWTLDFGFKDQGMTFVTIRNSAVARSMEQVGKPVCHMYAGMFAGVFSFFQKTERSSMRCSVIRWGTTAASF